jgi:mycothiol synthase
MTFTIRAFSASDDIPAWLNLRIRAEAVDQEGSLVDEETLRAQLRLPGHNPSLDRWVIPSPEDPATFVGSALIWLPPDATTVKLNILIDPEWRQRGLGSQLYQHAVERSRALGGKIIQAYVNTKNPQAEAFLRKHGFEREGAYHEMRQPMPERLPTPVWPYGYQVRTYRDVQNLEQLTYAMNVCYEKLWGHQEVSAEQMASWLPEFNQDGLFLVYSPSGKVVGISRVEPNAERTSHNGVPTGYFDAPGFHHHHRRMDLYRALLITGIRWLKDQDVRIVEMESWGDKQEILNLYQDLGFEVVRKLVSYVHPL